MILVAAFLATGCSSEESSKSTTNSCIGSLGSYGPDPQWDSSCVAGLPVPGFASGTAVRAYSAGPPYGCGLTPHSPEDLAAEHKQLLSSQRCFALSSFLCCRGG